ncbi:ribosomal protein S5 [mine drainage metagenome]|uniref:Ribosomal protein S5 n=1 Tax=mine drainage metagenome TaxID=410659 RepID=T0YM22_9ZZZZ
MIVRVHGLTQPQRREVCNHFIHIHVGAGSRAGLENIDGKLLVVPAGQNLVNRRDDGIGAGSIEMTQFTVGNRGSSFDPCQGMDEPLRQRLPAHGEVFDRTLGLSAPECIRRNPELTQAVAFHAVRFHVRGHGSSIGQCRVIGLGL